MAVKGDTIVIGAPRDDGVNNTITNQGSAYIFDRNQGENSNWVERQKLIGSDATSGDFYGNFGYLGVAISGDLIIVGAYQNESYRGAAYVFEKNGSGTWDQIQKITPSDVAPDDQFGSSLAISGDALVISSFRDDSQKGSAYVFSVASICGPSITTQPANQSVCEGSSASFSVAATSTGLSYQWRKNGVNLSNGANVSGATSPTLTVSSATVADAGSYDVVVTNLCGMKPSDAATLTVNTPPTITGQTISVQKGSENSPLKVATVSDGDQAEETLMVKVNGGASATVDGVTVSSLSVDSAGNVTARITTVCNGGTGTPKTFTLAVSDSCGVSATATLTVDLTSNPKPAISYNDQSVAVGGTLTVNPATGPTDNGTFMFELDKVQPKNGISVEVDAMTGVVLIKNVTKADTYKIDINVTDNCNQKTSATFQVTVTASAQ